MHFSTRWKYSQIKYGDTTQIYIKFTLPLMDTTEAEHMKKYKKRQVGLDKNGS